MTKSISSTISFTSARYLTRPLQPQEISSESVYDRFQSRQATGRTLLEGYARSFQDALANGVNVDGDIARFPKCNGDIGATPPLAPPNRGCLPT